VSRREIDAAGLRDPHLVRAYTTCDTFLRRHDSAAHPVARVLLPPGRRPYWDAILAFATYVGDLVGDPDRSTAERLTRYETFEREFLLLLDGDDLPPARRPDGFATGRPPPPFLGRQLTYAFEHFVRTWGIPAASVRRYLTTIRNDLHVTEYPRYADLAGYVEGVCGQGTRWGNALLEPWHEQAEHHAVSASFGLQLTDYLWDLREDLADGRLYLPLEELRSFGLSRTDVERAARDRRMTPGLRELVEFQTRRARGYFADAADWWRLVHPSCRELPRQYVRLGRIALERIERSGHDVFLPARGTRFTGVAASCAGFAAGYLRSTTRRLAARSPARRGYRARSGQW
jgi:phytoene synthase